VDSRKKTKQTARLQAQKEQLVDADILARLANLKESEVAEFRHSVAPDFLPSTFWEMDEVWKREQELLQKAWRLGFPPELSVLMISHAAQIGPFQQRWDQISNMTSEQAEAEVKKAKESGRDWKPKPESWPFQTAVMFLTMEPWRSQVCAICGKFFVVRKAGRDPKCSDECRVEARLRSKRNSWAKSGSRNRQRRRKRGEN
jgi:hypothetical protein